MKGFTPEHTSTENLSKPPTTELSSDLTGKLHFAEERYKTMEPVSGKLASILAHAAIVAANDEHFERKENTNSDTYQMIG